MKNFLFIVFAGFITSIHAQDYSLSSLQTASKLQDSVKRKETITIIWNALSQNKRIPLIKEDSVLFLYRGNAKSVQWMGDFNGWGYDKKFNSVGKRIPNTDIWYSKSSFPKKARLDYKIIIDDKNWILDPENSYQQWSGVGGRSPNSELRMPLWKEDEWLTAKENIPHGKVESDILMSSKILGYQINYSVYIPAVTGSASPLPVIYVTDGYKYLHPKMGNMITVLDNLIAAKKNKTSDRCFY